MAMLIAKGVNTRIVTNHWGWTPRGIARWIRFGWGWFETWGIEGAPNRDCLKIGPVAFSWACPNRED